MANTDCDVLIVGAGISGLTAAFRLNALGIHTAVVEATGRVGGVIESVARDGVLYERGPNSILETHPRIGELIDALGIRSERVETSAQSAKRYVVRRGNLVPLPASLPAFVGTSLFSVTAKLRLLREPFIPRAAERPEESVAEFVTRRLGREFLDYAVEPFVAGIYAGDPRLLSVSAAFPRLHALEQRYGSLVAGQVRGARERAQRDEKSRNVARSFAFCRGVQTLTHALAARAGSIHLDCRATRIKREADGTILVDMAGKGAHQSMRARAVILAVPAEQAATLTRSFAPQAAQALDAIPYAPVASVASLYRRADVAHPLDGFGFLAPRVEQRRILGTLFSSSMFAGRADGGHVLLTTFVGGQRNPALPSLPEQEIRIIVDEELCALLGAKAAPVSSWVTCWPRAIPQYTIGHLERMREAQTAEAALPGLFLCASYRGGVAVGDCINSAWPVADAVAAYLRK
jgi:oxygen-dependent protoporphyrinogen oxidase